MSQNEFLTHFGLLQRSVLELRGWEAYEQALAADQRLLRRIERYEDWTRAADVGVINRDFRGVFVTDYDTANIYGHLQAPVWWLRGMSNKLLRLLKEKGFEEVFDSSELGSPVPVLDLMPKMDGEPAGQIYDDHDDLRRQATSPALETTELRQGSSTPRDDDESRNVVIHDDSPVAMYDDPPLRKPIVPPREPLAMINGARRREQLHPGWGDGNTKSNGSQPRPYSLRESSPVLLIVLEAMYQFMVVWSRTEDNVVRPADGWNLGDQDESGSMVFVFYAQSYFNYFRCCSPMPHFRSPLAWDTTVQ
ncbi:hypothetical protein AURDEDRAFT_176735 [Auricularia subglabra TFB-10046 SS5]|nr:hypothetical protein AURDEDRAFT_176735 [Auricularia subglabra TFB-10046 SS5]